jgi:D-glycero-D-manno-heptose 1,7-bisphosphate phosphatase
MHKAIFLDRDGTIIEDAGYLSRIEDIKFFPYSFEALFLLQKAGFMLFLVSNQSGIGKGKFTAERMLEVHSEVERQLQEQGINITGFYFCPHHPKAAVPEYRQNCSCRKPEPGLLLKAAREHQIDLTKSFMIGDKISDPQSGKRAGCRSILVMSGIKTMLNLRDIKVTLEYIPDKVALHLKEAAYWILDNDK